MTALCRVGVPPNVHPAAGCIPSSLAKSLISRIASGASRGALEERPAARGAPERFGGGLVAASAAALRRNAIYSALAVLASARDRADYRAIAFAGSADDAKRFAMEKFTAQHPAKRRKSHDVERHSVASRRKVLNHTMTWPGSPIATTTRQRSAQPWTDLGEAIVRALRNRSPLSPFRRELRSHDRRQLPRYQAATTIEVKSTKQT
jgi:hypothetical protein